MAVSVEISKLIFAFSSPMVQAAARYGHSADRRIEVASRIFRTGCQYWRQEGSLKISARNVLKGKIVDVKKGATTAIVKIDIGSGIVITSSITNEAVDGLSLAAGNAAYAVIKASEVMIGID